MIDGHQSNDTYPLTYAACGQVLNPNIINHDTAMKAVDRDKFEILIVFVIQGIIKRYMAHTSFCLWRRSRRSRKGRRGGRRRMVWLCAWYYFRKVVKVVDGIL